MTLCDIRRPTESSTVPETSIFGREQLNAQEQCDRRVDL